MSLNNILNNPALRDHDQETTRNEEWNNFMHKVGEVSGLVKDMVSGDKKRADMAQMLADKYLGGKILTEDDVTVEVKSDRTVINRKAFRKVEKDSGIIDKDAWMAEMSKDADKRALDRKIRKEKAETLKTQAVKAFRRQEYDRALSCYNKAIEQIRDNAMMYCDRALVNIKLGNYQKVFPDCETALRLNENSFKARLYKAKAHKELDEDEDFKVAFADLEQKFPQHRELVEYFLNKNEEDNAESENV